MKNAFKNKINIIFSTFLIIGYIVCAYFFNTLAGQVSGTMGIVIRACMLIVFGLLLFYATRVGEGRQVKRFSLAVLLMVDIPALFIILAGSINGMPLHDAFASADGSTPGIVVMLACVALGYGIPYTFFSGYEIKEESEEELKEEIKEVEEKLLEGGLAEELSEAEKEDAAEEEATEEEATEEAAEEAAEEVEKEAVEETAEEE